MVLFFHDAIVAVDENKSIDGLSKNNKNYILKRKLILKFVLIIDFNDFLEIMTTKMSEKDSSEELEKAFILFSQSKNLIEFADLKRIARELGETMSDD